jgi:hypothetical protein
MTDINELNPSLRELANQYLRTLTLLSDPCDTSLHRRLDVIRQANQLASPKVKGTAARTPDHQAADEATPGTDDVRSREFAVHSLVADLLMHHRQHRRRCAGSRRAASCRRSVTSRSPG